jgi:crotonobetainyl-CoA:carnitine CoA-transferase CaiB-like acyl-CoA transferase
MYAHAAVLEALIERGRTGEGETLSVSLFDATADWMTVPLLHQEGGEPPRRVGLNHPSIAPYGAYTCRGGQQVVISIQNEREWQSFCTRILDDATLALDPRFDSNTARCDNRPALDEIIGRVFARLAREDLAQRLLDASIAFGAVNSLADLADHPQLRRAPVATPSGPVQLVAPPVRFGIGDRSLRPVPALGEHGEAIREEFRSAT